MATPWERERRKRLLTQLKTRHFLHQQTNKSYKKRHTYVCVRECEFPFVKITCAQKYAAYVEEKVKCNRKSRMPQEYNSQTGERPELSRKFMGSTVEWKTLVVYAPAHACTEREMFCTPCHSRMKIILSETS